MIDPRDSASEAPHVLLVFPPQCAPLQPYLGIPSLTAYLRAHGVSVRQHDLNLDFYDTLLSHDYLLPMCQDLDRLYERLDGQPSLRPEEQKYLYSVYLIRNVLDQLPAQIKEAKDCLRSESFYDFDKLSDQLSILNAAFNVINIRHRVELSFEDLEFPIDHESYAEIADLILNESEHFIIRFFHKQIGDLLEASAPLLVGFSITYASQLVPALAMASWVKRHRPGMHVVFGGSILSRCVEGLRGLPDFFRHFADSVVLFEGERPLLGLVDALLNKTPLSSVPSLLYWDGEIVQTKVCPPEDVDSLPTPDFCGLSLDRYFSPQLVLPILSCRGCYWGRCAFCDHGQIYGARVQVRDPALVVRDLQTMAHRHNTKFFAFSDECLSPAAARRLSTAILTAGLEVCFLADVRLESSFSEELCQLMSRAGFRMALIGLESACQRTLDRIAKGIDIEQGSEILRRFHAAGTAVHLFVILGLPGETRIEAQETFDFVLGNKDRIFSVGASVFGVGRFSPIGLDPSSFGVTLHPVSLTKPFAYTYEFDYASDPSHELAATLQERFMQLMRKELPFGMIWRSMSREHLFLYLLRFSEAELLGIVQRFQDSKEASRPTIAELAVAPTEFYPSPRRDVYIDELNYDVLEIQKNLEHNAEPASIACEPCFYLHDLNLHSSVRITPDAYAILTLCTGLNSVDEIVDELTSLYALGRAELEQKVLSFLSGMAEQDHLQY